MRLIITEIHKNLFNGKASSVTAPTTEGEVTILPAHTAFVAHLREGVITVRAEKEHRFPITGGVIEVSNNTTTILL